MTLVHQYKQRHNVSLSAMTLHQYKQRHNVSLSAMTLASLQQVSHTSSISTNNDTMFPFQPWRSISTNNDTMFPFQPWRSISTNNDTMFPFQPWRWHPCSRCLRPPRPSSRARWWAPAPPGPWTNSSPCRTPCLTSRPPAHNPRASPASTSPGYVTMYVLSYFVPLTPHPSPFQHKKSTKVTVMYSNSEKAFSRRKRIQLNTTVNICLTFCRKRPSMNCQRIRWFTNLKNIQHSCKRIITSIVAWICKLTV